MKFRWERVFDGEGSYTSRAAVFGGWIIRHHEIDDSGIESIALVFVPDSGHAWKLSTENSK